MVEHEILDIGAAVDEIIKERIGRMFESNIELTRNAYGGDVIRKLEAAYKEAKT